MYKTIILLLILILVAILLINCCKESFQNPSINNGWQEACAEITRKRLFLQSYMRTLRAPVQDLSASLITAYNAKDENMRFQNNLTSLCVKHIQMNDVMGDACKQLASVDSYEFAVLPDMDTFYQNLLIGGYDLDTLLQQLNFYSTLLNCPLQNGSQATFDISDSEVDISRDIGDVDTETLALELENLSPYYLSPAVVQYLIKFLISQEQLDNLNYTSSDYINQELKLMNMIKGIY
jgi:hypothetical protein